MQKTEKSKKRKTYAKNKENIYYNFLINNKRQKINYFKIK
jgi:hypothetical protein